MQLLLSPFSQRLVNVPVVPPYSSMDMTDGWKELFFISSDRYDFHMIDSLSITDTKVYIYIYIYIYIYPVSVQRQWVWIIFMEYMRNII